MELTAEELKLIQDRRAAEAKKAEEAAKAARSKEEKAIELFQARANAQNADALDLCREINTQAPGRFNCVKNNMINAYCRIGCEQFGAEEVGFKNFGAESVTVSDEFGNNIVVKIDSRRMSEGTRYDPVNKFSIGESYKMGFRSYTGDKAKNAARIVIKRLGEMREKQVIEENKKNKLEIAKKFIQSKMPKANSVKTYISDYADYVKYEASCFAEVYEYTSIEGGIYFNEDMTVKSWTKSIKCIGNRSEKDITLKAMKTEYEEAMKALTAKFNAYAIEFLNG